MKTPLFLPFTQEILPVPQTGEHLIAYGLQEVPETGWQPHLEIIQPWRPDYLKLSQAGFNTLPQVQEGQTYDGGLLLLDKHRKRNENRLLHLLMAVKAGGRVVVCGDKVSGAASLRKWAGQFVPAADSLSKNHAIVFWLRVPEKLDKSILAQRQNTGTRIDNRFETLPGMFSHGRIDTGSALLTRFMPDILEGAVADFGAGWGYLSACALENCPDITALDLYEADYDALQVARRNLANIPSSVLPGFHWQDLTREQPHQCYDTIISNPPFHEGRAADVSLGQAFIRCAARALKPNGKLLLVANRHLPYETILADCFRHSEHLAQENGFKIILAQP
ncbi:MAG: Ribosomal RNA small subunit methyltransferase C [Candidatus Tokpelaia hoelldobleri]|uniref:Ribosomal RNA small subunit methyltransferase C n=1 Tax=Candidatus Tokpelaia hoelldobleri TaxID=1902579 RepID=A0A1U9JW97_9HYPH|nr:MAG: Ribosomal RNA small subunit methyltransferase C [Candidatus Tokpelaia hoelldoblerii]